MIYRNYIDLFGWGLGPWALLFLMMWIFFYVYAFVVSFGGKHINKKIFISNTLLAKIVFYFFFALAMSSIFIIGFSCAWWLHTEDFNNFVFIGFGGLLLSFFRIFFQDAKNEF